MNAVSAQRGLALPAAIFVITLMAILAVAINMLVARNAQTFEEELRLTRAFYAAESGAGIGMNALFPPEQFPTYGDTVGDGGVFTQSSAGLISDYEFSVDGLRGCSVLVSWEHDATVDSVRYYTVISEGRCGDVSRTVQVRTSF